MTDRPNVLLIVMDTARADGFGAHGGATPTPAFDALAERGRAVPRALSAANWTAPSHASMFSGLHPFEHGVTGAAAVTSQGRLASFRPAVERHADRWLPEVMRRSGYETIAVSANVWITEPMGFDFGFDRFVPIGAARAVPRGAASPRRGRQALPPRLRRAVKRARRATFDYRRGRDQGAVQALRALGTLAAERRDRPFFCFVNVMETHAPYLPPRSFNPLRGWRRYAATAADRYQGSDFMLAYNLGAADAPGWAIEALRSLYAGEVRYVDRFLGLLMDRLQTVLDRTLVIVTSDHGENLGEDHRLGHQLFLDERLLHVPFAVAGPGAEVWPDRGVYSTAGLPRSIATAAGLEDAPWEARDGVAIAQYESGWKQLRNARRVVAGLDLTTAQRHRLTTTLELATDGRATLLREDRSERLEGDAPAEAGLRAALDAAAGRGPAAVAPAEGVTPEEEEEIEERLRDLGYL